ncbi:MAG: c-type cytochrome [Gemmatimonadales bacterium]|nr:c-type cytochrome [Gemmatimonadales bacterium]NIN12100.1 c-type cytochrome [Gemmatimonadales bacterium]NIR03335.1 c-type cytochrome [Gemmatimonadales bacterium]NIS67015.1 c-type cytochrome [Gemmatimonadales bacterium]
MRTTTQLLSPAIVCAILLGASANFARSQQAPSPPGVTDSSIARGKKVFRGAPKCDTCHGSGGQGTEYGPNLTDDEWIRGSGTYDEILQRILHGVTKRESKSGLPMPMRGWGGATDAEVRAVAAYVWSLSHERKREP